LYAMPYAYSQIHDIKEGLQKTVSSKTLQPGEFNSFHGLTIYIRERTNSNDLKGILIHDNRNKKTPFIITAEAGTILKMPEGMRLVLINGARHEAEMTVEAPPTLYFDQYMVDTESPPSDSVRRKSPYERNLNDLLNPTVEIAEPKRHSRFRAYGHQRLLNPLQALAITLISLAFLLSGQINRRRRAKKIVIIVVCASMLQLLLLTYFNTGQIYWFAIPLAYATIFLSTLLPFAQINEWFNFSQPFKPAQSNEIESPRFQRDSSADDNAEKDPKQ
jgi:lipopolysaccharide export system permease protein